jgi:FtsP/CotA-like multicopper oxidase with cupredoxin domain
MVQGSSPLVIHAEQEAHAYDDEFTIVLSDWYHERATKLNKGVRAILPYHVLRADVAGAAETHQYVPCWRSTGTSYYQDGMRAPLVIHAEQEAHAYDDEFTIVLSDWYHERGRSQVGRATHPGWVRRRSGCTCS